jgi:hypothetical protein
MAFRQPFNSSSSLLRCGFRGPSVSTSFQNVGRSLPAARMGGSTTHGGTIVAGAPTVLIG